MSRYFYFINDILLLFLSCFVNIFSLKFFRLNNYPSVKKNKKSIIIVNVPSLKKDIKNIQNVQIYACGSNAMIMSAKESLASLGISTKNFFSDAFIATG